jgi:antitoxin ParD1/3/4
MASFAIVVYPGQMPTMNVSLPDELRSYIAGQIEGGGFGSTSEYVRDLIRQDRDRQQLRDLLLAGATSGDGPVADDAYFASLRDRVRAES